MRYKLLILCLLLLPLTSGLSFTPQGDIDLRDIYNITGAPYVNATTYYGDGSQLTGLAGGGDINAVNTNGDYLTGGTTSGIANLLLNETKLNSTIELLDSDTTYTNGTGLSLVGTAFSITLSYFQGLFLELTGGVMTGDIDMSGNNILNVSNYTGEKINVTCCVYLGNMRSYNGNSINIQPTSDEDDFFSFKTPAHRPTIKREGGKVIYIESSNVYDVGISARADDTYSGTINYEKDNHMMTLLGKNSPVAIKTNSEYRNYFLFETYDHQPQISVYNGTKLLINDSLEVNGNIVPETNATFDLGTNSLAWDNVYAVTYNDLTPAWVDTDGSAISAIAKISNNGNKINHTSYPIKLRSKFYEIEINETKIRQVENGTNETTNETIYVNETYYELIKKSIEVNESLIGSDQENYAKEKLNITDISKTKIQFTRDIGGTITMMIEAVKELFDWNDRQDDLIDLQNDKIELLEYELIGLKAENQIIKLAFCKEFPLNELCK